VKVRETRDSGERRREAEREKRIAIRMKEEDMKDFWRILEPKLPEISSRGIFD
jgi:hypothetical protein